MSTCGPDQHVRVLKSCARILLLLLSLPAALTNALPDDRDQPIHITADKALRDEKKGVTIYSGSVQMKQGSLELEADTLTIYHTSDEANEIIAEGHPAKIRQQPELNKGVVNGHANVITYYRSEERVHLQTDARIEQEGAVVDGDSIDYLIAEELITAESDQTREGNKVVVVIPPNVQKKDNKTLEEQAPRKLDTPPATKLQQEDSSGKAESE
jgi:lipopolysaccharide export system protein LptA